MIIISSKAFCGLWCGVPKGPSALIRKRRTPKDCINFISYNSSIMEKNSRIDELAHRAQQYNIDELMQFITDWQPEEIRKNLLSLYFFSSQAAFTSENLIDEQGAESFYCLQRIIESLAKMNDTRDALLTVRVR